MSKLNLPNQEAEQGSIFVTLAFVFYLYSGHIRPLFGIISPILDLVPFLASLFVCFLCFIYTLFCKKVSFNRDFLVLNALVLFITALIFFSSTYTSSEQHYLQKIGQWFLLLFSFWFAQAVKLHRKTFIYSYCFGSLVVFLTFWVSAQFQEFLVFLDREKVRYFTTLYLGAATYIGTAIILVFFLQRNLLLLFGLMALLVMTGARGPLIFLILCFALWAFMSGKIVIRAKLILFMLCVGVSVFALGVYFELPIFERFIFRFGLLFEQGGGDSVMARVLYLKQAFDGIEHAPWLGNGVGSFGFLTTGVDFKEYPHNILLEAWYDLGILGLLAFTLLFIYVNVSAIHKKNWALFVLVNFFLFNALKSSSYVDHRVMMALLALLVVAHKDKLLTKPMANKIT